MDKFIKIQSNQSEFSNTANLVDFVIPQGDIYDLSDSWCNLEFKIDVVETETASGVGVYDMSLQWITTDPEKPKFFNSAIIRDCHMENSRQGLIESIRRIDQLSQARQTYEHSWGEAKSSSYLDASQNIDPINRQQYGISRQFNKEGINKSIVNNNSQIMVKLGDLMDFCNTPEYDTNKGGQTRIHFRLNMDRLEGVQNMLDANIVPNEVKEFKKITALGAVNTITLGKQDGTADTNVISLEQVPYYVGMKVLITATHTDGGADNRADAPAVISAIDWNKGATGASGGVYSLTFEQAWGATLTAGKEYTAISVKPQAPIQSSSVSLSQAQIVLKKVASPQGGDAIEYTTFSTEEGFGNSQTAFSDQFVIEPEATNMLLCFNDGADGLVSKNNELTNYQVSVNNVPQTDRLVAVNSPLDFDRKSNTFRRMGGGLRNLTQNSGNTAQAITWGTVYADAKFNTNVVASPLPVTDRQKLLQLNINATGGGVGKYSMFKSLPRRLVY
jgi:hypothetical protein